MIRVTQIEARDGYRIWLSYSDGTAGEINLSHLVGHGVFKAWNDCKCFEMVHITSHGAIAWGDDIELCPDALYMRLTGKSIAEMADVDASFANA